MYTLKQPTNDKLAYAIDRYRTTHRPPSNPSSMTGRWQNHEVQVVARKREYEPMTRLDYVVIVVVTTTLVWAIMHKEKKSFEHLYALCPEPESNFCRFTIMSIVPVMGMIAAAALYIYERRAITRKNNENTLD